MAAKGSRLYLLLVVVLGGVVGVLLGRLLDYLIPAGTVNDFFTKGVFLGMKTPLDMDLLVMEFSFRLGFNVSLCMILGILLAVVLFLKWGR